MLRSKKWGALRDKLPDEVFLRLRGALFFGPGFKVTRNKLNFRDKIAELLATAIHRMHPSALSPPCCAVTYVRTDLVTACVEWRGQHSSSHVDHVCHAITETVQPKSYLDG